MGYAIALKARSAGDAGSSRDGGETKILEWRIFPIVSGSAALALVGLSLTLATSALSVTALGVDALAAGVVAGLVAATIGAVCVALISRAPGEMCGPRASIAVIYAALCADLVTRGASATNVAEVWAALSVAVVLMGLLQIVAGCIRLGEAIKFMPYPVNAGFVTGIGLLIVWSQVGPLMGLEGRIANYEWPDGFQALKPAALLVGAFTAGTVWALPSITKRVQPMLAGIIAGTVAHQVIVWSGGDAGPTLAPIAAASIAQDNVATLWSVSSVQWLLNTVLHVLPYAAFLAFQGIMNAAVSSVALSDVTGVRANLNRTLVAQGVGNIVCGVLAALPIGTSPSQSMVAGRMKGLAGTMPLTSPLLLLLAVLVLGGFFSYIPVAALAGILITVGVGMIDRWARGLAKRVLHGTRRDSHVIWNFVIVAAVAASFFFGSVPLALLVGAVLATILLAINLSAVTTFNAHTAESLSSTRVWQPEQAQWLVAQRATIKVFRPRGGLFFGTADQLAAQLAALGPETRYCVMDLSRLTTLDATGCQIVAGGARKLAATGVTTVLAGLNAANPRDRALIDIGLTQPDPNTHWFDDLDHALEWIETQLVSERWPTLSTEARVDLADTPLTKGLSRNELEELRGCLRRVELAAGPLFRRGDPGATMFIIDEGAVEIRISGDGDKSTRLAAFGAGGIFGEIALLTSDTRTADAVCLKPTRLYELTRDTLAGLERRSPQLYARILTNLNAHLANRLIIATGIVEAHR